MLRETIPPACPLNSLLGRSGLDSNAPTKEPALAIVVKHPCEKKIINIISLYSVSVRQ
jgi:hypothetical protein